jgi:hypothetical protein
MDDLHNLLAAAAAVIEAIIFKWPAALRDNMQLAITQHAEGADSPQLTRVGKVKEYLNKCGITMSLLPTAAATATATAIIPTIQPRDVEAAGQQHLQQLTAATGSKLL